MTQRIIMGSLIWQLVSADGRAMRQNKSVRSDLRRLALAHVAVKLSLTKY